MKRKIQHTIICSLVLVLIMSFAYAQNGTIKGKVRGKEGALPAATVSIENKTVITDKHGEFSFSLKPGIYSLVITHAGYKKNEQEVKIEAGNTQIADFIMTPVEQLGEVVVLGSRSLTQRSNLNTPVPVDVFSSDNLVNTGRPGLTQMLNVAAPSFNASRELLNESVTLRGLNPDQILILVNGSRYHNMAYINASGIRGHLGRGSVANDLNSIPFSAVEKIEILRDGASAQYGSDAIAGVINIILKETTGKTLVQLHSGQYYKGDGENISLGMNYGISVNKKGFLNFSAGFRYRGHTHRGGEYKGTVYKNIPPAASYADSTGIRAQDDSIIQARNFDRNYISNAGNSKLRGFGIVMNGGYPIGNKTELFWTAAVNSRKNTFMGGFVFPKNNRQVNTDLFPDGFKPYPIQYNRDVSGIAGVKSETKNKWYWKYSSAYGSNTGIYKPENTNNASQYYTLGKNAPTKFYTGELIYQLLTNNIDFAKKISTTTGKITLLNIGYGFEWRRENYRIKAGEDAAWQNYDSLGRKQGGAQNGLIFQPDNVVNENRNVLGTYIDLETEFNDRLLLDLAGRYEYYSDFGGNLAGKIAMRYKLSDPISLRGSVSNGFRAPSIQQRYYSTTSSGITNIDGHLVRVSSGIFRNTSEVAKAFGVASLQAEKSLNLGIGFTSRLLNRFNLTVDAYWIQIKNRVVQSGSFDRRTNAGIDSIFRRYNLNIDRVEFFANAINTRTRGIDLVLNSNWNIKKVKLVVMLAANITQTHLFGETKVAGNLKPDSLNTITLFNRLERIRMERGQPDHKIILSLNFKTGKFGLLVRTTRFGKTSIASFPFHNDIALDEFFSPKILTDISIGYSPKTWLTITAGANNVFDVYPDRLKNFVNTGEGQFIYAQEASPFGYNGGYYFVSMAFNF